MIHLNFVYTKEILQRSAHKLNSLSKGYPSLLYQECAEPLVCAREYKKKGAWGLEERLAYGGSCYALFSNEARNLLFTEGEAKK